MGKQLVAFFEEAEKLGGLQARIRLAKLTLMAAIQAEAAADAPDVVKKFQDAMSNVRKDFGKGAANAAVVKVAPDKTRRLNKLYMELFAEAPKFVHDLQLTSKRITETAVTALDVSRASVWLYDEARTGIECIDLYERTGNKHSAGVKLGSKDFATYFKALETERVIDAEDAHTDPRTSCFSEVYLKPLGINSMLDVPIWTDMKMMGVVCHEHTGPARKWLNEDADFAFMMASLVARSLRK